MIEKLTTIVNTEIDMPKEVVKDCFLKSETIENFTDIVLSKMSFPVTDFLISERERFNKIYAQMSEHKQKQIIKDRLMELLEKEEDKFIQNKNNDRYMFITKELRESKEQNKLILKELQANSSLLEK